MRYKLQYLRQSRWKDLHYLVFFHKKPNFLWKLDRLFIIDWGDLCNLKRYKKSSYFLAQAQSKTSSFLKLGSQSGSSFSCRLPAVHFSFEIGEGVQREMILVCPNTFPAISPLNVHLCGWTLVWLQEQRPAVYKIPWKQWNPKGY